VKERVANLVSLLSLSEKLSQLITHAPAIERLGIEAFNWGHEALHGVVSKTQVSTVFPYVCICDALMYVTYTHVLIYSYAYIYSYTHILCLYSLFIHSCTHTHTLYMIYGCRQPIALGATFDVDLYRLMGTAVSDEARAFVNRDYTSYGLSVW